MVDGTTESNSATATAEPITGQSVGSEAGTPTGQSGPATTQEQSASAEENFSNIDPKTLSPEMQAVYKNLQADYTKKTQAIAETRKKAEAFDQVRSRSDFNDWWSGASKQQKAEFKEQKAEAEKTLGQKITDDEFTKAFENKDSYLAMQEKIAQMAFEKSQKKIEALEQQLSVRDASDFVDSFATEAGPDGKPMRPDFYKLDEDQLITGFLSVNPPEHKTQEAYRQRLDQAYTWAKTVSTKYYESGKAEALKIIQQKAAASSQPPTNAVKGAYSGPDPKKITPGEALQMAKKGQRIPQVYD